MLNGLPEEQITLNFRLGQLHEWPLQIMAWILHMSGVLPAHFDWAFEISARCKCWGTVHSHMQESRVKWTCVHVLRIDDEMGSSQ